LENLSLRRAADFIRDIFSGGGGLGAESLSSERKERRCWIASDMADRPESLLKAKAWLWSMISSGLVALVLIVRKSYFSGKTWKIAPVLWVASFSAEDMAEKRVTLVTVTSSWRTGKKIPAGTTMGGPAGYVTLRSNLEQHGRSRLLDRLFLLPLPRMWPEPERAAAVLYDPWSGTTAAADK